MMMNVEQSVEWELAGESEVLGDLASNPGRRGGKLATNRLSYCAEITCLILKPMLANVLE
jgi:hypothetical protein